MGLRFRKSFKIAPGVRWNIGTTRSSLSIGAKGFGYNFSTGGAYSRIGIPGTGLSYRTNLRSSDTSNEIEEDTFGLRLGLLPSGELGFYEGDELQGVTPKIMKHIKSYRRDEVEKWLGKMCKEANEELDAIKTIHHKTPDVKKTRKFKTIPYDIAEPIAPVLKKVGFLGRFFKSRRIKIENENLELQSTYDRELADWKNNQDTHEREQALKKEAFKNRTKDSNTMEEFLSEYLSQMKWPKETNVSFEFSDDKKMVTLDVDLPEIEDLPSKEASVVARSLKLTYKEKNETTKRKDYMTHIHGIGFRLIGEIFSFFPELKTVILSGYSQRVNRTNGNIEDDYLYSVKVNKEQWETLNFKDVDNIDPIECLASFELRRKMTKTGVFTPIEPLTC